MKDYVKKIKRDGSNVISVIFIIEKEKILNIGDKINEINDSAYMNGYNWASFINYYLKKYNPEILKEMKSNPEAGMYSVSYALNAENEKKTDQLVNIIEDLVENESKIYELVKSEGNSIKWD